MSSERRSSRFRFMLLNEQEFRVLRSLAPFLAEHRLVIGIAMLIMLLVTGLTLVLPFLLKHVVDSLAVGREPDLTPALLPVALVCGYVAARFINFALRELNFAIYGTVTVAAMRRVSLRLLQHLHQLDLNYHLGRQTGAISRDMDRGVNAIAALLRILAFQLLNMAFGIVGVSVIMMTAYDFRYTIMVLLAVVFYVTYTVRVTDWRTPFIRESNDASSRANTRAVDSLINYETVKYFSNECLEYDLYDKDLAIWASARRRNRFSLAALNAGQAFFVHAGMLGMMLLSVQGVLAGQLTLGDVVAINAFAVQVFIPLNQLGGFYRELKRCFTDVERMFSILETPSSIRPAAQPRKLPAGNGPIEFRQVSFAYEAGRPVLQDISFTVEPGQRVALVGRSGAGKSTITRLLFRFYDVDAGEVLVNGVPVPQLDADSLRRAIAVVPQDCALFNDSLLNNIAYGNPEAGREEIWNAIRLAQLEELVAGLPNGLETLVGERGLKLSGGERQRVAIARAILKRPKFLLFDEATSSLDTLTEERIMQAINTVSAGHTTLMIAHRLSTIAQADRILVLSGGRIVEQGDHDGLLAAEGLYAELWWQQNNLAAGEDGQAVANAG